MSATTRESSEEFAGEKHNGRVTIADDCSAKEKDVHSNTDSAMVVEVGFKTVPPARHHIRSKSLGAAPGSDDDETPFFTFRLPHDCNAALQNNNADAKSDNNSDYNVVLDNYVEYADHTKIPRLRGKDVDSIRAAIHSSHWLALSVTVIASCVLTYSISNFEPNLNPDLSQALVITLVLATFPEVAASSGAGAFAGMVSDAAIPNYGWLALLAVTVSFFWFMFHRYKILVGCGGRLGTCAFISMNLTVFIAMLSGSVEWSLYGDALWSERLELTQSILMVLSCTLLSAVSGFVRLNAKIPLNPVQAPTTLVLVGMLVLQPTGFVHADQVAAGLAVGSFVAMASEQYLGSVVDFAGAGFVAGLWILLLEPFFLGFGGKKGFTSFCGFATYVALKKLLRGKGKDQ